MCIYTQRERFKAVMALRLREMAGLVENKDGMKSQAQYSPRFKLIYAAYFGPFTEGFHAEEGASEKSKSQGRRSFYYTSFCAGPMEVPG